MTSFGNKGHARAVCLGACQRDTGKDDEDSLPGWPGCTIAAPEVQLRVVVAGITEIACAFTVIARLYDGVAHLVAHLTVYSRLGNLVQDDHDLRPMESSISNFYSKWGYIADPPILSSSAKPGTAL